MKDQLISVLRTNNMLLNEDVGNEIYKCFEDEVNVNNVTALYYLSRVFKLSSLTKLSMSFIQRCFPMVSSSQEFLELDFISVVKVLSSNELMIDSEMQVFNAAEDWFSNNVTERSKYAANLLQRVRLRLLSDHALNYLLNNNSSLLQIDNCSALIKQVIKSRKECHSINLSTTIRYCNQNNFNIMLCGGKDKNRDNVVSDIYSFKTNSLNSVSRLPQMMESRQDSKAVFINGEVYVFGGVDYRNNPVMSVEKYCIQNNTWEIIAKMFDKRKEFCGCSFMDSVYVIGGFYPRGNSCIKFNTQNRQWNDVAGLNESRTSASCTVFEGRIVVSGGYRIETSNSVEAYDHIADSWSYMPYMIEDRSHHKSVAVKNKLFVVGGLLKTTCEVFDSTCNKFVLLKQLPESFQRHLNLPANVFSIGSKLVVLDNVQSKDVLFYYVENDEWTKESFEISTNLPWFGCVKVPQI